MRKDNPNIFYRPNQAIITLNRQDISREKFAVGRVQLQEKEFLDFLSKCLEGLNCSSSRKDQENHCLNPETWHGEEQEFCLYLKAFYSAYHISVFMYISIFVYEEIMESLHYQSNTNKSIKHV